MIAELRERTLRFYDFEMPLDDNDRAVVEDDLWWRAAEALSDRSALKSLPAEEWNRAMTQAIAVIQAEYERVLSKQYPDADGLAFTDTVNLNIRMATVLLPELMKKIDALKRPTTSDAGEK